MSKKQRRPRAAAAGPTRPQQQPAAAGQTLSWSRVRAALRSDAWTVPLAVFAGSRIALFLIPLLFRALVPVAPEKQPTLASAFAQWDTGWYVNIATSGYKWAGPDTQSNVAFFPLYPLLGKLVSFLTLGDIRTALLLVSNVAFLFYLYYLYRLAKRDFDPGTAERAIFYVAIFFLSFFFSSGYTESLMLALATAAFFYAREGRWRLALALGFLTTLTRLTGMAILLPLAWEWYKQRGVSVKALSLAVVPAGLGLFMLYLWRLTGDPLAFSTVQAAWHHNFTWPWGTFGIALQLVTTQPLSRYVTAIAWIDFLSIVGFLILILISIRVLPPAYWLYSLPVYIVATSATLDPTQGLPTASITRYLMSIFPAFLLLALAGKNRFVHYLLVFFFAVLLGPLMLYFFAGVWVE